jgi:hypothetical protein
MIEQSDNRNKTKVKRKNKDNNLNSDIITANHIKQQMKLQVQIKLEDK